MSEENLAEVHLPTQQLATHCTDWKSADQDTRSERASTVDMVVSILKTAFTWCRRTPASADQSHLSGADNEILSVQHWSHETGEGVTAAGSRADIHLRKGNPSLRYGPVVVIVPQDRQCWTAGRATGEVPQIREAL